MIETRAFTEEEKRDISMYSLEAAERASELDMWYVVHASTTIFGEMEMYKAFFDDRFDMEHYVAGLLRKFSEQDRVFYIKTDEEHYSVGVK